MNKKKIKKSNGFARLDIWTPERTTLLINSRIANHKSHFVDKSFGSGWKAVILDFEDAKLLGNLSESQIKKKWNNLLFSYKKSKGKDLPYAELMNKFFKMNNATIDDKELSRVYKNIDFSKCRLCQKLSIEHYFVEDPTLCKQITSQLSIEIAEDLPNGICTICFSVLQDFQKFVLQCRQVDSQMKRTAYFTKPNIFKCPSCPSIFDSKSAQFQHFKSHQHYLSYLCSICKLHFSQLSELKTHLECHNLDSKGSKDFLFQCTICSETFSEIQNIHQHVNIHDVNYNGNVIYKQEENSDLEFDNLNQESEKNRGLYFCTYENCKKSYKFLGSLRSHKLTHVEDKIFLCQVCGKKYSSLISLKCHEKSHLTGTFKCDECEMSFSVLCTLNSHKRKYHQGIRFYCSQCPKMFLNKSTLDRHELTHTGYRAFICDRCKKAFYTEKELVKHKRYHDGKKLYKCQQCYKSYFEKHHLTIHMRSHTGERPYPCKVFNCKRAFVDKQKLKRHMKIHTANKT